MNQHLQPIEYQEQRILTTQQIADAYGTTERRISENFNRNKKHYVLGIDYFIVEGEELQDFKENNTQFAYQNDKNAPKIKGKFLYLWTEYGALLHAKSLNTDEAWKVYKFLRDDYYRLKSNPLEGMVDFEKLDQLIEKLQLIKRMNKSPRISFPVQAKDPQSEIFRIIDKFKEQNKPAPTIRQFTQYLKTIDVQSTVADMKEQGLLTETKEGKAKRFSRA